MRDGGTLVEEEEPGPALPQIDYTGTLDAALQLADAGIPVFPVALNGTQKTPAITDWRHTASTDEQQLRQWFIGTTYLIGVPTGAAAHYDVLDVDPRHGGDAWFVEHEHQIPTTCTYHTLQGGRHLLFRRLEGMRNSTGKLAPGVDVRAEGGFVVYWPGHGLPFSTDAIASWPPWLADLAMAGRARRITGGVPPLSSRRPPSADAVIALLDRMPNPLEVTRDTYVDVMLAAKGCIDALTEAGALDDFNDESRIVEAAIGWAERWEGGSENPTDEAAKWDADWAHRAAPLAGWQTLTKVADALIPGHKEQRIAAQFADPPPAAASYAGNPHWPSMLRTSKNGVPQANLLMNARIAFRHAPEWQGVLAQNLFSGNVDLLRPPPFGKPFDGSRQLDNITVLRAKEWLEINYVTASKELVLDALKVAASDHAYHPVRAMLDSLSWDHVDRGDTWMIRHLGVEDTPLHRAYGMRFLISMIARVRQPGCKVDTVPILEGPQGQQKSALLRALADPWFTDHMPDLADKDAQLQLLGVWLVEFAEYGQLGRADANRAKNFVTIQADRLRRPYEAIPEDHHRQCVMAVTLNPEAHPYLQDVTGNRRFWPMLCGATWPASRQVDLEAFKRERSQLLAEADYCFKQGEKWWLHEPALIAAHEASVAERVNGGPLLGLVARALQSLVEEGVTEPSYDQVCARLGFVSAKDQSVALQRQVGAAVTLLGWTRRKVQGSGVRGTFYSKA